MLKLITAATALTVLVACDSEGIDRATDDTLNGSSDNSTIVFNDSQTTDETADTDNTTTQSSDVSTETGDNTDSASTDNTNTGNDTDTDTGTDTGNTDSDADADSNSGNDGISSDDDTDAATADVDQTNNLDGGSSTSDGGQSNNLDGGSSTSDGGQVINDDDTQTTPTDNTANQDNVNTDAGSFSSGVDGDVIRVSSIASDTTENLCTTRSNPDDYSNIFVGDFILHNNAWRTFRAAPGYEWQQCITANTNGEVAGWNYDWGPGITGINGNPSASGDFYVRSYPELIYGTKDEYRTSAATSVTGLPVRVSDMPNFRIDYSYDGPQFGESRVVDASNNSRFPNGSTISGERNVAIESFFYEPDASGACSTGIVRRDGGSNHTYEVMVWLDAGAERLPAGPDNFVADLNIRGQAYKVYTKSSDSRYVAFVAQNPQTTGTLYWNDFTDWARQNASSVVEQFGALANTDAFQDDWCMANIIVGTEIFWGAGDFDIYDWTITQSN